MLFSAVIFDCDNMIFSFTFDVTICMMREWFNLI